MNMKKFEIKKANAEIKVRDFMDGKADVCTGCAAYNEDDSVVEESFDTLEEALEGLKKYKTSVRYMSSSLSYYLVEEYFVECNEYDEDDDWIEGGEIYKVTEMQIEVYQKPSRETIAIFDNLADAERFINDSDLEELYTLV